MDETVTVTLPEPQKKPTCGPNGTPRSARGKKIKPSVQVKRAWKNAGKKESLKQYALTVKTPLCDLWIANKRGA